MRFTLPLMKLLSARFSRSVLITLALFAANIARVGADETVHLEAKPGDPYFAKFEPKQAPAPKGLLLRSGDRLAIIGDSITEQRMYSRIMETYLTVCVPELKVTTRQFGWSGETAEGFVRRMTNDCLRFQPTVATTCYGMNDHRYRAYDEANGQWYRENSAIVVRALKGAGSRVVLGSPGCVGQTPRWASNTNASVEDLNLNLCKLRNLDVDLATQENVGFADVFWPMLTADFTARKEFGADYAVAGKDGVHPDWAGHVIMAYAFLKAMGLDGDLGAFTVDLAANKATATGGHKVDKFAGNTVTITSSRYPFCATGASNKDNSIRSGMTLVPFNAELNRLNLVVNGGTAAQYAITWGSETRTYSAAQLAAGVNLAEDFAVNPFSEAFAKVDAAVADKQKYETRQIKELFHGPEGKADLEATAALTEKARQPLADRIAAALVPVTHTIRIEGK
jgi:lysophospholipase L1-like esterase